MSANSSRGSCWRVSRKNRATTKPGKPRLNDGSKILRAARAILSSGTKSRGCCSKVWRAVPRIRFDRAAIHELVEVREWYSAIGAEQAVAFATAASAAVELLLEHPRIGQTHLAGTRRLRVPDFPYYPFYR